MSLTMQHKNFLVYFVLILISLLFNFIHSSILTNLCPGTPSCNCTLTNNTDLDIICNSSPTLTELPILVNNTLQTNVIQLRVSSSIIGTHAPLITLPTNICLSYPNIAILDLSSNSINGLLNTSKLACLGSNLINIDISNNFINDIEINFFKANKKLQTINLSQNNLTIMPMIDGENFINFSSTITLMNFSYNQIINVDFWPLFVKTGSFMIIDMSNNLIENYTNNVPVFVKQFTETPDPRILYLNNNQLERLSDLLLEQYGACSTISPISTAYFVVGISNILLTNNPLICDCESYHLITFINDNIYDFPQIYNRSALLTQAICTLPLSTYGQKYLFSNFTESNSCQNYTLPNITDIFCSVYINNTILTLPPPTYWPSTTTILTTIINENATTIINENATTIINENKTTINNENKTTITNENETTTINESETTTNSGGEGGNGGSSTGSSDTNISSNSTSPSWYIILGIVLGLVLILFLIVLSCYLCKDKLLLKKCRSKFINNDTNPTNSYEPIIRHSELSSQAIFPLNGTLHSDDDGIHSGRTSTNGHHSWSDKIHPEQETQTRFQIVRPKPSSGPPHSISDRQRITNNNNNNLESSRQERKSSLSTSTDVATNTTNIVKGIPISSVTTKIPSVFSNGNNTIQDTSTSELSVTSIPLTPSRRAKLLPQVKSGVYVDSTNSNLLNTSAGVLITNQRQRRRSSTWLRRQHQNIITSPLVRPKSMSTQKTSFTDDDSSNENGPSIPTIESLTNKPSKSLRTLPLLNITVIPAWIDDNTDQK